MTFRVTIRSLGIAFATLLAGCGGGGGSPDTNPGGVPVPTVPAPVLEFKTAAEKAFFTESFEFSSLSYSTATGYISNAADVFTGGFGRKVFERSGPSYVANSGFFVSQVASVGGSTSITSFDAYMARLSGSYRNASPSGYTLNYGVSDLATINNIKEVDISGRNFADFYSSAALAGRSGVFPANSKAYTADFTSSKDVIIGPAINSIVPGSLSVNFFADRYSSPASALCIGDNSALVFPNNSTAISYSGVLGRSGFTCSADPASITKSHVVTSKSIGTGYGATTLLGTNISQSLFFQFSPGGVQVSDLESVLFTTNGSSTQPFGLLLAGGPTPSSVVQYTDVYRFPAGTVGHFMGPTGIRLNKIALNGLLSAFGMPTVP